MTVCKTFVAFRKTSVVRPFKISSTPISTKFFPPSCKDCKYNLLINNQESICRLFCYSTVLSTPNSFKFYVDSEECRRDPGLCGPDARYFKPK